jgi:L-threonine kinase
MSETVLTAPAHTYNSASTIGVGVGRACGTFGELLQGALPEPASDFLVTLPIARWSAATFMPGPAPGVRCLPGEKQKARRLAEMMLSRYGVPAGGLLRIDSELPEGKGMASSSADLVATARAVAEAVGARVTSTGIEDLLREIEPTDGVMYSGVVAFHHRRVQLRARLGTLPPLTIVGLDEGGAVDTIAFNGVPKPFTHHDRAEYRHLLDQLATAVVTGDVATVGRVSTRSAVLNQKLRRKRTLRMLIRASRRIGGLGVVVAHSGTVIGMLLADSDPAYAVKLDRATRVCTALSDAVRVEHLLR